MMLFRCLLLALLLSAPASPATATEPPDPLLRMELEKRSTIPGQPIVLRVTVLVPTWFPNSPVFPSFEIPDVMVRLPSRAAGPTSEQIGGETWSGVTRAYRLYPMTAGNFTIPPRRLRVTYAHPETRAPITLDLRSDAISFQGIIPRGAEGLDPFIAAESLVIEQKTEGRSTELAPGDTVTRSVTARVEGMSPLFLPPLIPALDSPAFSAYPKEPLVTEQEEWMALSGERTESVTYVAVAGGNATAQPIRLRWYNLKTKTVEAAEAEGFGLASNGPPPSATTSPGFGWSGLAPWVPGGVLGLLVFAIATLRVRPRIAAWRQRQREAHCASEAYAFALARTALRQHDLGKATSALALWSARLRPVAGGEEARLSEALARLGAARYGPGKAKSADGLWSEAVEALRAARRRRLENSTTARAAEELPPLNPGAAR